MQIIDGRKIADKIEADLKKQIEKLPRPPGLCFILVGDNPASQSYIKMKKKMCQDLGIVSQDTIFPPNVSEAELLYYIDRLNSDETIDGILVQLPLPPSLSTYRIMNAILPSKDVDGFHPINMGKMLLGESDGFKSCTPLGVKTLLEHSNIIIDGKHVVILGRSNIVGKPLAAMLMQKAPGCNATVTVVHSHTENLKSILSSADILIAAIGKPHFVTADMIKPGAVVIDVGINRAEEHLIGDVDFEKVAPLTSYITPVPGGVGPMTIAMLMSNTVQSCANRCSNVDKIT